MGDMVLVAGDSPSFTIAMTPAILGTGEKLMVIKLVGWLIDISNPLTKTIAWSV